MVVIIGLILGIEGILLYHIGSQKSDSQVVIASLRMRKGEVVVVRDTLVLQVSRDFHDFVTGLQRTLERATQQARPSAFSMFAFLPLFSPAMDVCLVPPASVSTANLMWANRLLRLLPHVRGVFHPPRQ